MKAELSLLEKPACRGAIGEAAEEIWGENRPENMDMESRSMNLCERLERPSLLLRSESAEGGENLLSTQR